ncbi:MAG: hypothetical protein ACYDBB_14560 [Armatimonadota bacterium]
MSSKITPTLIFAPIDTKPARTTLTESDVVFMYWTDDEEAYRAYQATVVAWGGAHTQARVAQAAAWGLHATGTMWCLTAGAKRLHENADLREAVVRDIAGDPIAVPWLPDHTYEGTPSWWGCTNHPTFRAHNRAMVCEAMAGGATGLHVDDHLGAAAPSLYAGGCFCDHCMRKFAWYLHRNSSPAMLEAAGLAEKAALQYFDYRALVRRYAATRKEYQEKQRTIPLHREFITFQLEEAAENVRQLHELAQSIVERPVTLSANTGLPWSPHMLVMPHLSYLVGEVEQHAKEGLTRSNDAVVAYHFADTLRRPIAATAAGWDWAYVKERGVQQLVCYWIAQAYACGQRFMTPHRMWCFTPELGTHWYDGPTEAYAPLYRFVQEHAQYFDGYQPAGSDTAILVNPKSTFFGPGYTMNLLQGLSALNVPYTIFIPQDDWHIGDYLSRTELYNYSRIITVDHPNEPLNLWNTDKDTLNEVHQGLRKIINWPLADTPGTEVFSLADINALLHDLELPWESGNPDIWVFPRKKRKAPPVIHVLNRSYNPGTDTFTPQRDITLRLSRWVYQRGKRATLYRCDGDPLPVGMKRTGDEIVLTIPELGLWGMIVLE